MTVRRSTRDKSRALGTGSASGGGSTRGTPTSAQRVAYHEPPTADLPGLFPVHDGSYGINTHVNLDPVKSRRRGQTAKSGFVNEEEEDRRFVRQVGRRSRRHGMEDNLRRVVQETVEEAERDEDNENPEEPHRQPGTARGEPGRRHRPQVSKTGPPPPYDDRGKRGEPERQEAGEEYEEEEEEDYEEEEEDYEEEDQGGQGQEQEEKDNKGDTQGGGDRIPDADLIYQPMAPHIPTLGQPYEDRNDDGSKPPYTAVEYSSPDPYALIHNSNPTGPSLTKRRFYGLPIGQGSSTSKDPDVYRRGYSYESSLYREATVRTPSPTQDMGRRAPAPVPPATSGPMGDTDDIWDWEAEEGDTGSAAIGSKEAPGLPEALDPKSPKPAGLDISSLSLTEEESKMMQRVLGQVHASPGQTPHQIVSLDHLTLEENRAARSLIRDMGRDKDTVKRIVDELDKAAAKRLSAHPAPSSLFGPPPNKSRTYPHGKQPVDSSSSAPGAPGNLTPVVDRTNQPPRRPTDDAAIGKSSTSGQSTSQVKPDVKKSTVQAAPQPPPPPPSLPPKTRGPKATVISRVKSMSRSLIRALRDLNIGGVPRLIFVFLSILTAAWLLLTLLNGVSMPVRDDFFSGVEPSRFGWNSIKNLIPSRIKSPFNDLSPPRSAEDCCGGLSNTLQGHKSAIANLKRSDDELSKLMQDLNRRIPAKVFVELDKRGKPKISEDFWHALRDLIREDDIILTLENVQREDPKISDAHWHAIQTRLEQDRYYTLPKEGTGKTKVSPEELDHDIDNRISRSWQNWLDQNEGLLKEMVAGTAITKHEFMKLFQDQIQVHREEIRREFADLENRVQDLADTLSGLRDSAPPAGMTAEEVQSLTDAAIKKALQHAVFDAVASGGVHSHTNDVLNNAVNFFSPASGATIDPDRTSETWRPAKPEFRADDWFRKTAYPPLPPLAALMPWDDESECFCAGSGGKAPGGGLNALAVLLSYPIIPQHLAVDHLLPGATLDPGAMPRDIEVWIEIDDLTLRAEVLVFSANSFPDTPRETALNEAFVKVGHFTYEARNYGDGVQVFKLSDELTRLGASTSKIVVRAVSNYGADHTCFYRLRMFGQLVEGPDVVRHEVPPPRPRSWWSRLRNARFRATD
ncbi:hypothetical protein GGS23DRAFT_121215 [Durotheca rogersii]|uniref:uncharacterized protein n=1 Tax=Durotheca rogersii TaxID=419775 RepID=UPI0022207959|nr:uncharacterized protein GGS23DRAFT_121215 [Durotheca rogersii]KAI5861976.1 hypothetical protein GGS23DRAFT_121215 [Durotheca rogersii]